MSDAQSWSNDSSRGNPLSADHWNPSVRRRIVRIPKAGYIRQDRKGVSFCEDAVTLMARSRERQSYPNDTL